MTRGAVFLLAVCCLQAVSLAQDAVIPGAIHVDASLLNIGIRWQIGGDDNLNAFCTVRYRAAGAATWKDGLDLVRTHPYLHGEAGDRPDNRFAGSVFFLDPDTPYEFELDLTDPDGGNSTQVVVGSTRTPIKPATGGRIFCVVPGSGGGPSHSEAPLSGLQAAADIAEPGDVFYVTPGIYEAFTLTTSGRGDAPIVFRGLFDPIRDPREDRWAIVDGGDTSRGVCTIGTYNTITTHIIVENMVFQNGYWGIDAQNTQHIVFRRNILREVGYGYYNRRGNGWDGDQMISDCLFTGRTPWPGTGIPAEQGISLRGGDNNVCYNRVMYFGDGISVQPTVVDAHSNDIWGNDIAYIVDDPIEIDYNVANCRVWRNRVVNGRMGISVAPIYGGPVYIMRNEFFNLEYSAYKMNRQPSGLVIIHNTSSKLGNGTSSDAGWQNTLLRNNVILGTRYVFEEYGLVSNSVDDWDYDAVDTPATPFAKWNNVRYQDLDDLKTNSGIEAHAVASGSGDLVDAILPQSYTDGVIPGSYDLRLRGGVAAVDAGAALPNINDFFVIDGKPDCGTFEQGAPLPHYGPRR